jgi:hypothetical protein
LGARPTMMLCSSTHLPCCLASIAYCYSPVLCLSRL